MTDSLRNLTSVLSKSKLVKAWCLTLLLVLLVSIPSSAEAFAFERDDGLWVAHLSGSGARKIGVGNFPDLSPDGRQVAFVTSEPNTKRGPVRRLAVANLANSEVTVFELPGTNCIQPRWAPDGKTIAFSMNMGLGWDLCLVNADGSQFRILKAHGEPGSSSKAMCWAPGGQAIFYHDFDHLYRLELDGAETQVLDLRFLGKLGGLDGGSTLSISQDGQRMLIDIGLRKGPGGGRKIWSVDLVSGKATRLVQGSAPRWIGPQEFLFMRRNVYATAFYRLRIGDPDPQLLFRDGWHAGVVRRGILLPRP